MAPAGAGGGPQAEQDGLAPSQRKAEAKQKALQIIPAEQRESELMRHLAPKPPAEKADEKDPKARKLRKQPGSYHTFIKGLIAEFVDDIRAERTAETEKFVAFLKASPPMGLTSLIQDLPEPTPLLTVARPRVPSRFSESTINESIS